ncbi:hypothetical protein EDC01DRAFT_630773 [Geopyxis carbonaria]|nr:hypothetical protein EDC01DRAFT_630773 [Geopyxis carbonaria]
MEDSKIQLASNAMNELRLSDRQSSTARATASSSTVAITKSGVPEITEQAPSANRPQALKSVHFADMYDAPHKGNAAKRRRESIPEPSFKRIREEDQAETSTTITRDYEFKLRRHSYPEYTRREQQPWGVSELNHVPNEASNKKVSSAAFQSVALAKIAGPDAVLVTVRQQFNRLQQQYAALRCENDVLRTQQTEMEATITKLNDELRQKKEGPHLHEHN